MERLQDAYTEGRLALGVGAGVSMSSRIPSWRNLVVELNDRRGTDALPVKSLEDARVNLPAICTLLERDYPSRRAFAEGVREALYGTFPSICRSDRTELVKFVQEENSTLHAVGAMCARREPNGKYGVNSLIKAIVNYNLDQLLQKYTRARYKKTLLRTIERASSHPIGERISTYHPHGLLRFDKHAGDLRYEAPDLIVLTERDYFDVFNDPNSIFTYTMLHLLRESSFLFVGLSMTDENLRRLLHYSRTERIAGYRDEHDDKRALRETRRPRHFAIVPPPRNPEVEKTIAESLAELGVATLWVEIDKIPDTLGEVYQAAGNWSDVFYR